jgi:hypothetical protein
MADTTKEKKGFKPGVYAVFAGIIVAVLLVVITIFAFTTRYTAFSPDKVAQSYVDTIVQTGDGYNAYKNTLVSKNQKYGNFVINAYMLPYVNEDAQKAEFVGTGNEEETKAIDTVYSTMYDYYVELINEYGLDDYDSVYTNYFAKLSEVRKEVYGDEYMDTDFMFGAFESNVSSYGDALTGTQRTFASDDKTITQEETTGLYQEMFGTEQDVEADALVDGKKKTVTEKQLVYKFVTSVTDVQELSDDEAKAYATEYKQRIATSVDSAQAKAEAFGLENTTKEKKVLFFKKTVEDNKKDDFINAYAKLDCADDIDSVALCTVEVTLAEGNAKDTVVATQQVYVVKIGNSWYVDNTNVDTSALYFAK